MTKIRYADIRKIDISNGDGYGVAIFVQGCHFHCDNCFNKSTWDFSGGKEWTNEKCYEFVNSTMNKSHIKRVSILGGEPLASENLLGVLDLVEQIKHKYDNDKTIWLYTGYTWEQIFDENVKDCDGQLRQKIISKCDVIVDGRYVEELKDINYRYAGSTNQRVIKVKKLIYKTQNKY